MASDLEKAHVTELLVRMDCNGCAQRIKRAINSIHGVHNVCIDIHQQKITVVGRAEPEILIKAIKKTRKIATVSSHNVQGDSDPQPEAAPPSVEGEVAAAEAAAQVEPTTEAPPQETSVPEESPEPTNTSEFKDVEQVHMVHEYPYDNVIREHWNNYNPTMTYEAPYNVIHSYNN